MLVLSEIKIWNKAEVQKKCEKCKEYKVRATDCVRFFFIVELWFLGFLDIFILPCCISRAVS